MAARNERTSVDRTLIVCFLEVIVDDRFFVQVSVLALKFVEFLDWLLDANIPLASKIIRTETDKAGHQERGKIGIAKNLKSRMFNACDGRVRQKWVLFKYVGFFLRLLLSNHMG